MPTATFEKGCSDSLLSWITPTVFLHDTSSLKHSSTLLQGETEAEYAFYLHLIKLILTHGNILSAEIFS